MADPGAIDKFFGLRNGQRGVRLPYGSLKTADNVYIDNTGAVETRPGSLSRLALSGGTDLFGAPHFDYAILVDNGGVYSVDAAMGKRLLGTGYTEGAYQWAQVENLVAFAGSSESGMVVNGQILTPLRMPMPSPPDAEVLPGSMPPGTYQFTAVYRHTDTGIESGAPPSISAIATSDCAFRLWLDVPAGYEADIYATGHDDTVERLLSTLYAPGHVVYDCPPHDLHEPLEDAQNGVYSLPLGVCALAFHEACLFAAVFDARRGVSDVFRSEEYRYRWFRLNLESFSLPGRIIGMASTSAGLLALTDRAVGVLQPDGSFAKLADYGGVPGRPIDKTQDGAAVFWTKRGLCAFPPFSNLFYDGPAAKLSVASGSFASVHVVQERGCLMAVTLTDTANEAFNPY